MGPPERLVTYCPTPIHRGEIRHVQRPACLSRSVRFSGKPEPSDWAISSGAKTSVARSLVFQPTGAAELLQRGTLHPVSRHHVPPPPVSGS